MNPDNTLQKKLSNIPFAELGEEEPGDDCADFSAFISSFHPGSFNIYDCPLMERHYLALNLYTIEER